MNDRWTALGTAFLVGPDLVMTNWHVATELSNRDARVCFDCALDAAGKPKASRPVKLAAEWRVAHSEITELDFALVRLAEPAGQDAVDGRARSWLVPSKRGVGEREPFLVLQHPQGEPLKLGVGSVTSVTGATRPRVTYTTNTSGGSSGSPCFTLGLEVVALHQKAGNSGIPLAPILDALAAKGIALPPASDATLRRDDRRAAFLERVRSAIERALAPCTHAVASLIEQLEIAPSIADASKAVADELVFRRSAVEVARVLNWADAELAKDATRQDERRVLRRLIAQLLPVSIDWTQMVVAAKSALSTAKNRLDLPLSTTTIAAVVLAGIDERECRFRAPSADGELPLGLGMITVPAIMHAPVLNLDGTTLAQAVVQKLAAELTLKAGSSSYAELRDLVDTKLEYFARDAPPDERLPYCLLFTEGDEAAQVWGVATSTLASELPALRLVRLTGGDRKAEQRIAHQLQEALKRA